MEHQSVNPSEGGVFVFLSSLNLLGTTGGVDGIHRFYVSLRLAVHPRLSRWVKRSHRDKAVCMDKAVRAVRTVGRHHYFRLDSAMLEAVVYVNIRIRCGGSWLYLKPERKEIAAINQRQKETKARGGSELYR